MAETPIVFRPMSQGDLVGARNLWKKSAGVELAEGDSPADLADYLIRNPGLSFVAVAEKTVVGAVLAGFDGRRGLLYHLAVAKKYQRNGIGEKLVRLSLNALKKAKVRRVLILVSQDNAAGKLFGER